MLRSTAGSAWSQVACKIEQQRRGHGQAAEVGAPRAGIGDDQPNDGPTIRQVVADTELQQARAIAQIRIDEAAKLELRYEGVGPIGA